jgi:Cu(I)/Ag(I) efflux system periplasmic protein CusF
VNVFALAFAAALVLAGGAMAAAPAAPGDPPAATQPPAHRSAKGVGVVTEIDAKEAVVTLKHQPIPALGWPSMTMPFHANPASLLNGLKVGDKVAFDTREADGLPEITAIRKP